MPARHLAIRSPFLYSPVLKMRKVRPRVGRLAILVAVASVLWASNPPPASAAGGAPSPPRQPKVDWAQLGLPNPAVLFAAFELEAQRLAAAVRLGVSAPLAVLRS
jgi:hypothetical protein